MIRHVTATASAPPTSERAQLHEAAQQFEAIFLRQMLTAARSTSFDSGGVFDSEGEETFREMRDSRFADIASKSGAIGLAANIEAQLARHLPMEG